MYFIKYSKFIIIGSGPSGFTSAIYICRALLNPILITGNKIGGQLINTNNIENWPGLNSISGYNLMNKFFIQVKNLGLIFFFDEIYKVNFLVKPFIIYGKLNIYISNIVIIATGVIFKLLSINNEKKYLSGGISLCGICDGNFYKKKFIMIVGGGDVALENVIYLNNIVEEIILIHRNNFFGAGYCLIEKFFLEKIKKFILIKLNTILIEIIGNNIFIKCVKLKNLVNNIINILFIDGLFLFIGNIPNTFIFYSQLLLNINNFILLKNYNYYNFTSTNIKGIFASGDVCDYIYQQAVTSSAMGCVTSFDSIYYYKLNY